MGARTLHHSGLLDRFLPLARAQGFTHTTAVVDRTPAVLHLRLAATLHEIATPDMAVAILQRLKYDNRFWRWVRFGKMRWRASPPGVW